MLSEHRYLRSLVVFCALVVFIFGSQSYAQQVEVLYVDENASDCQNADGLGWGTAYCELSEALAVAGNFQNLEEIWVAQGTYHPSQTGDIDASFVLPHNVRVFGGFDGTEQSADERDPATNITILSGDLNEDDDDPGCNVSDNSRHVVKIEEPGPGEGSEWAVLDGFTFLS